MAQVLIWQFPVGAQRRRGGGAPPDFLLVGAGSKATGHLRVAKEGLLFVGTCVTRFVSRDSG